MRRILVLTFTPSAIALALVITLSVPAQAAFCIRMKLVPDTPDVGQPARLELRTLVPFPDESGSLHMEAQAIPATYPFRVRAIRPGGEEVPVQVQRSSQDPKLWIGHMAMDRAGAWQVRVLNFEPEEAGSEESRCYAALRVTVGEATDSSPQAGLELPGLLLLVLAILAGAAVIVTVLLRGPRISSRKKESSEFV
jgi:hypothetical protein